jgi:hypothetical protein
MAAWLIPALKAVLPHVGTIISVATPVFTRKKAGAAPNQTALLQQQVSELQSAASQNAASIKALAAQLQRTRALCAIAIALSVIASCGTLLVLVAT